MKSYISILCATLALVGLASSCQQDAVEGGKHIQQTALLYQVDGETMSRATTQRAQTIGLSEGDGIEQVDQNFAFGLVRPAEADVQLSLRLDEGEAKAYLTAHKQSMEILPANLVELPTHLSIKKGDMKSETGTLSVRITEELQVGVSYIFAVSLDKAHTAQGKAIQLSQVNRSLVYTLKKSPQGQVEITKALQLERPELLKFARSPFQSGKYYDNFTIETLISVDKFRNAADAGDAQISTLFGIEGSMLFRFGDAGVPGNYLQAYGQKVNFEFQTNRWYHIAAVFKAGKMSVFVDGKELITVNNKRAIMNHSGKDPWYVGRSWNTNRGIQAKFAEMRIWEVARSADELTEGMFGVDPSSAGLLTYWKMDSAEGSRVKNIASLSGADLLHVTQVGEREKPINIVTLPKPIELEE